MLNGIKGAVTSAQDPTQLRFQQRKGIKGSTGREGSHQQLKADTNVIDGGAKFQPQQQEFGSIIHGSDFGVKNTIKGLWNLVGWLRKGAEARHVAGVSLQWRPTEAIV